MTIPDPRAVLREAFNLYNAFLDELRADKTPAAQDYREYIWARLAAA